MKKENPKLKINLLKGAKKQISHHNQGRKKIHSKKKNLIWLKISGGIVCVLILILAVLTIISIGPAKEAYAAAMAAKSKLAEVQKAAEQQDLERALVLVKDSENDFKKVEENLNKLKWLKFIPFARYQFIAAEHLFRGGTVALNAFETTLEVANKIAVPLGLKNKDEIKGFKDLSSEQKGEILKNLREGYPDLERAYSQLELAETEFDRIPSEGVVTPIKDARNLILEKFPAGKKVLKEAVAVAKLLPSLAGYPEEQTYFILFENNTELRAAGGFIGSYGIVKLKNAEIKDFTTHDVYNLDRKANINVEPPWQFKKLANPYMKSWYLRDSNWSPDFAEAAKKALWFYNEEGGQEKFSGVIGITPDFISYLLEITGPTKIPGFPYTFTHENFAAQLEYHVEINYVNKGIDFHERKDIMSDLAQTLISKILALPKDQWLKIAEAMERAFMEKQAAVFVSDENLEKFLDEKQWAGKIQNPTGDFIMVVDSNMASLKTDEFVERSFEYSVDFNGSKPVAEANLTYQNNAPGITWKTTRYRTWTRLYTPADSNLVEVRGNEQGNEFYQNSGTKYEISDELGKKVFGSFISIEPQAKKTLTFKYELPQIFDGKDYKLYFQKQIGVKRPKVKIVLKFPKKIKSYAPVEFGKILNEKEIEFNADLQIDREYEVKF